MSFEQEIDDVFAEVKTKPVLALVPPAVVLPPMFEKHLPHLEAALEGTFHKIADVVDAVMAGRAQFWPGKESALVTEIDTISGTKVIRVWLAGGNMDEIVSMAPGIEAWARLQGCVSVLVEGRKGWEKVMKAFGYEPWIVTLRKGL